MATSSKPKQFFFFVLILQVIGLVAVIVSSQLVAKGDMSASYLWAGANGAIAVAVMATRKKFEDEAPNLRLVLWACAAAGVWVAVAQWLAGA